MITKFIQVPFFEAGDFVRTPNGVARVIKPDKIVDNFQDYNYGEITVAHKFGYSNNPSNYPVDIEREVCILISPEEYDAETY